MAYESRHLRRFKCRYNNDNDDNPLTYQLVKDGAKVTPTSATIAIYKPGVTTAVLAATAMTKSGTLLTYNIDTTTTADFPVGTGYRAHIVVTATDTYEDQIIFDVAKLVPFGRISRDQLVALDDRVKGMEHAGDEDFSEIIEAVRDEVQLQVETKVINDNQLLEDMILDQSRLAVPSRFLTLAYVLREKGFTEDADYWEGKYDSVIRMVLGGIKYDTNQDLEEDGKQGHIQTTRLVM